MRKIILNLFNAISRRNTGFCQITELKQHWEWSLPRWVTACIYQLLYAWYVDIVMYNGKKEIKEHGFDFESGSLHSITVGRSWIENIVHMCQSHSYQYASGRRGEVMDHLLTWIESGGNLRPTTYLSESKRERRNVEQDKKKQNERIGNNNK